MPFNEKSEDTHWDSFMCDPLSSTSKPSISDNSDLEKRQTWRALHEKKISGWHTETKQNGSNMKDEDIQSDADAGNPVKSGKNLF